jgi:SEC-C motif-containing protein
MTCPCGTGLAYDGCCGRFHRGEAEPPTAEALMRSRYSAFAVGDRAWLLRSWHSRTRPKRLTLDADQEWIGLVVLSAVGSLFDAEGTVEFRATWTHRGRTETLQEKSRFVREDGRWVYLGALPA